MEDKTYRLALLPDTMERLGVSEANSIEENLRYLIRLFPAFEVEIPAASIGSYGYLELSEQGAAGDGFVVQEVNNADQISILVQSDDLNQLKWTGKGWNVAESSATQLRLTREAAGFWDASGVTSALSGLLFGASSDLDAFIFLAAKATGVMSFDPIGPVALYFRGGAVWSLLEGQGWTWRDVEDAALTWAGMESLSKENTK